jgi:hypothetical protein
VSCVLSASAASASPDALTEAAAIRIFLEHSPQARRAPLIERSVAAALRVEALWPNPDFVYQVEDAAGVRDEFMTLQQGLSITGRRRLLDRRAAAAASAAAPRVSCKKTCTG